MKTLLCIYRVLLLLLLGFIGFELYSLPSHLVSLDNSICTEIRSAAHNPSVTVSDIDFRYGYRLHEFQQQLFSEIKDSRSSGLDYEDSQKLKAISTSLRDISSTLVDIERRLSNSPSSSQIDSLESVLQEISTNTND